MPSREEKRLSPGRTQAAGRTQNRHHRHRQPQASSRRRVVAPWRDFPLLLKAGMETNPPNQPRVVNAPNKKRRTAGGDDGGLVANRPTPCQICKHPPAPKARPVSKGRTVEGTARRRLPVRQPQVAQDSSCLDDADGALVVHARPTHRADAPMVVISGGIFLGIRSRNSRHQGQIGMKTGESPPCAMRRTGRGLATSQPPTAVEGIDS